MKRQVLYRPCREFLSFDTFEHVFYRTNILVSMLHYGLFGILFVSQDLTDMIIFREMVFG